LRCLGEKKRANRGSEITVPQSAFVLSDLPVAYAFQTGKE